MKKIILIISLLIVFGFGCSNDKVAELENRIDLLEKKQSRMQMIFEINNGFSIPNYEWEAENIDELLMNQWVFYSGEKLDGRAFNDYSTFNDFLEMEDDEFIELAMKLVNNDQINVIGSSSGGSGGVDVGYIQREFNNSLDQLRENIEMMKFQNNLK